MEITSNFLPNAKDLVYNYTNIFVKGPKEVSQNSIRTCETT